MTSQNIVLKKNSLSLLKRRHFVPASQEWYNSIYTYNKNYPKTIPVADISLMKLFKGYFNYGIRLGGLGKLLKNPKKSIFNHQIRALPMRYRLLSTKKAFVGKGDLKHTNNKVIITFYLYNAQEMFISDNFNSRVKALLLPNKSLKILSNEQNEKIILYNRMFNIYEFLALDEHYEAYYNQMASIIKKRNIVLANINYLLAIYIYILKTKLFNDPPYYNSKIFSKINSLVTLGGNIYKEAIYTHTNLGGKTSSASLIPAEGYPPLAPSNPPAGGDKGLEGGSGTKGLKDPPHLVNNLFNRFFNKRLAFYRLKLKTKLALSLERRGFLITPPTPPMSSGLSPAPARQGQGDTGLGGGARSCSPLPKSGGGDGTSSLYEGRNDILKIAQSKGGSGKIITSSLEAEGGPSCPPSGSSRGTSSACLIPAEGYPPLAPSNPPAGGDKGLEGGSGTNNKWGGGKLFNKK